MGRYARRVASWRYSGRVRCGTGWRGWCIRCAFLASGAAWMGDGGRWQDWLGQYQRIWGREPDSSTCIQVPLVQIPPQVA
jgi:hypothetical protein